MKNKEEKVKSFFDKTHIYLHKHFGIRVRMDIAADLLGGKVNGKRMIDLGCGNGDVGLQFIDEVRELHFLDISDKMLDIVKEKVLNKNLDKVKFFNCDLEKFEVIEKYDVLIAFGLLMHVNSPAGSIAKMHEMLKDGGLLLIQYTNYKHPISRFNKFFFGKSDYELNPIDKKLFFALIEAYGFQVIASFKYSLLLKGLGRFPDSWLYRFHRWTYKNKIVNKFGMDHVYLLKKQGVF